MKEEIKRIMRLVQEGKLSPEDAAELIDAFSASEAEEAAAPKDETGEPMSAGHEEHAGEVKDPFRSFVDFMDNIGKEVSQSVNWQDVAKQVRVGAKKGVEQIKIGVEQIKQGKVSWGWLGAHEHREVSLPLSMGKGKTLRIENPSGDVKITGGAEEGQVHAQATIRGTDAEDAKAKADSYTLIIEESDHYVDIKQPDVSGLEVDLVIQMAGKHAVEIKTENGEVKVLDTEGGAKVTSQNGDILLRGLKGVVEVTAQNGDLKMEDCDSPTLSIENKSGDIQITDIRGNLTARTASGDVKVRQAAVKSMSIESVNGDVSVELIDQVAGTVNIRTVNGDAELLIPDMCDCRIAASTLRGEVTCDVPLQDEHRLEQRITGRLGDGTGAIDVSAVNGDISVKLRDVAATVE